MPPSLMLRGSIISEHHSVCMRLTEAQWDAWQAVLRSNPTVRVAHGLQRGCKLQVQYFFHVNGVVFASTVSTLLHFAYF